MKNKAKRRSPRKLYAIIMRTTVANGTTYSPWEAQMAAGIPERVSQDVTHLRDLEEQLSRYRNEDTDKDRQYHGMVAEHATALRREEEKGYARGLADGQALAEQEKQALRAEVEAAKHQWKQSHDCAAGLRAEVERKDAALRALWDVADMVNAQSSKRRMIQPEELAAKFDAVVKETKRAAELQIVALSPTAPEPDACVECGASPATYRSLITGKCFCDNHWPPSDKHLPAAPEPSKPEDSPLPVVGDPVDVVPEAKFTGDNWFRTTVSRVFELAGAPGRYGFEVHGRCGIFLPRDEVGVGAIETWKRVHITATREPDAEGTVDK